MLKSVTISENVAVNLSKLASHLSVKRRTQLARVAMASEFANRYLNELVDLIEAQQCEQNFTCGDFEDALSQAVQDVSDAGIPKALRKFRRRQMLRILFRDIVEITTTQQTLLELSYLADSIINFSMTYCYRQLVQQYGVPMAHGRSVFLNVIAMGKLGGMELNFSSDIDLIFAYSQDGYTEGAHRINNQQFFVKQVQAFNRLLTDYSPDGIVYRVDLRLRPFGSAGPLAMSFIGMENYYQEQGRGWERYAMVKARVIGAKSEERDYLSALLRPFVYRRYVDFGVIETLRGMKALIAREESLLQARHDIKCGRGGIRELEFIVQSCQLTRGGRIPAIQGRNLLCVLQSMVDEQLMHTPQADALSAAYLFLRRLENCLQMYQDRQVCVLPNTEPEKKSISLAMNFSCWDEVLKSLKRHQDFVSNCFNQVLKKQDNGSEQAVLQSQLSSLWQGILEPEMAEELLVALGFSKPDKCNQWLDNFRGSPKIKRLSQSSRMRLDKCMLILLSQLSDFERNDVILLRFIQLLESIVNRSPYISLLIENQQVITHLLHLFAQSEWIASLVANHPFLLEGLIEDSNKITSIDLGEYFKQFMQGGALTQTEYYLERLGQFKLTVMLSVAAAELFRQINALEAGEILSELAELILKAVIQSSVAQLKQKYSDIEQIAAQFAIVAYGKLGSNEVNYESDLDLVFLHQTKNNDALVTRLSQKILHALNTRSSTGVLYPVDTRLRPSGSAGLLVSSMDAFADYQLNKAWTWENQALIKARIIWGSQALISQFNGIKKQVLSRARDRKAVCDDIGSMRQKMRQHQERWNVKNCPGGLIDVEFLIQYLVLVHAFECPMLCAKTRSIALLDCLYQHGFLTEALACQLKEIIAFYHREIHFDTLLNERKPEKKVSIFSQRVTDIVRSFQLSLINNGE